MFMLSKKRTRSILLCLDKEENTDEKKIDIPFVDNEPFRSDIKNIKQSVIFYF